VGVFHERRALSSGDGDLYVIKPGTQPLSEVIRTTPLSENARSCIFNAGFFFLNISSHLSPA
jgi:hypothetical protein